jgi:hypothetical protein
MLLLVVSASHAVHTKAKYADQMYKHCMYNVQCVTAMLPGTTLTNIPGFTSEKGSRRYNPVFDFNRCAFLVSRIVDQARNKYILNARLMMVRPFRNV